MKLLVTYCSPSGSSRVIAEQMGATARDCGWETVVADAVDAPGPEGFDAVLTGSGVRKNHWHPPAEDWLRRHRDALAEKPFAAYSVGLLPGVEGAEDRVASYGRGIFEQLGLRPLLRHAFPGSFDPQAVTGWERAIMKAKHVGPVDRRDLGDVDAWTREALVMLA